MATTTSDPSEDKPVTRPRLTVAGARPVYGRLAGQILDSELVYSSSLSFLASGRR